MNMTAEINIFTHFFLPLFVILTIMFVWKLFSKDNRESNQSKNHIITKKSSDQLLNANKRIHQIFNDNIENPDLSQSNQVKLFDINPPQSIKEIEIAFINRETELVSDVKHFHAEFRSNKINVIHGSSRTGKSHYMKKLLIALEKENRPFWIKYINANSKETVRYVFHRIFRYLKDGIEICADSNSRELSPDIQFIQLLSQDLNKLIDKKGPEKIASIQTKSFYSKNHEILTSIADLPDFIKASLENKNDHFFYRPSDNQLAEIIKYQAEFLVSISNNRYQSVLLAIDDVDLLYLQEEGLDEVDALYKLLSELSVSKTINILITTRQNLSPDRGKDFDYFRKILPLKEPDFKSIYQKRIELYHQNQAVFTPEALDYLIQCADGSPGIFLNHCKKILREISPPISRNDIHKALDQIVERYLDKNSDLKEYVKSIQSQIFEHEDQKTSLTVNLPINVSYTKLIFFFISPTPQPGEYEVNQIIKDYFQSKGNA